MILAQGAKRAQKLQQQSAEAFTPLLLPLPLLPTLQPQGETELHPGHDLETGKAPLVESREVPAWVYLRYNVLFLLATCE